MTSSHTPGSTFAIGSTSVKYTATDGAGNVSSCTFQVTVLDETLPVISGCPSDINARAGESGEVEIEWTEPTVSVTCGEVTMTSNYKPKDVFPVGTTVVEYTAVTQAGKSATCQFNVIVSYEDFVIGMNEVITPDGDGINDYWELSNIEKFEKNTVLVVDRWGSVIYSASGYNNENVVWKGENMNGVTVPTGTYYYTVSFSFLKKTVEKRGFIEVVR
jgi:gliding motility-associated-like protein